MGEGKEPDSVDDAISQEISTYAQGENGALKTTEDQEERADLKEDISDILAKIESQEDTFTSETTQKDSLESKEHYAPAADDLVQTPESDGAQEQRDISEMIVSAQQEPMPEKQEASAAESPEPCNDEIDNKPIMTDKKENVAAEEADQNSV